MKLGTRLVLVLAPTVALIMVLYARWALEQREAVIVAQARRETEAYATTLGLVLSQAFEDLGAGGVQGLIDEISREPKIYGILVYGADGTPLRVSSAIPPPVAAPAEEVRRVIRAGAGVTIDREIGGRRVLAVLRPIRDGRGGIRGALEVAEPLWIVQAELSTIQQRYVLNTLTLVAAVTILILWLSRRLVARPVARFVAAVRDVGRGEFGHRISGGTHGELAELTVEFNLMAGRLETARHELLREADERLALERRLRQSGKMAAVGKLAAGLAHEIAAPLNVIQGRAEMLLRGSGHAPDHERQLRIIVGQIGRITTIVHNLLDFSRRREPQCRSTDLCGVLDGVVDFLEGEFANAGITVAREEHRPLWVWADPDLLHQVLVNLLLNAVQALEPMEGARRITVRTNGGNGDGPPGARTVALEVVDNGPGIPEADRARIFEPFFTTKPRGTGLGLVVARGIVEEHGGSLNAGNVTEGRGAVFRLVLPRHNPEGAYA